MQSLHPFDALEHSGPNMRAFDARMLLPKRVERTAKKHRIVRPKTVPYSAAAKAINDRVRASAMPRSPTGLCAESLSAADTAHKKAAFEADAAARREGDKAAYTTWYKQTESEHYVERRRWARTEAHRDDQHAVRAEPSHHSGEDCAGAYARWLEDKRKQRREERAHRRQEQQQFESLMASVDLSAPRRPASQVSVSRASASRSSAGGDGARPPARQFYDFGKRGAMHSAESIYGKQGLGLLAARIRKSPFQKKMTHGRNVHGEHPGHHFPKFELAPKLAGSAAARAFVGREAGMGAAAWPGPNESGERLCPPVNQSGVNARPHTTSSTSQGGGGRRKRGGGSKRRKRVAAPGIQIPEGAMAMPSVEFLTDEEDA